VLFGSSRLGLVDGSCDWLNVDTLRMGSWGLVLLAECWFDAAVCSAPGLLGHLLFIGIT
jgi:hypothetical protein